MRTKNNQSGFGIMEALIAMGLLSIVGLGIAELTSNTSKMQAASQAKDQQQEVTAYAKSVLSETNACRNTFGTIPLVGATLSGTLPNIKNSGSIALISANSKDRSGLLEIVEIAYNEWESIASNPMHGRLQLKINLKLLNSSGGTRLRPDPITLYIEKNPNHTVSNCYPIASSGSVATTEVFWERQASSTNIFYTSGAVGIGTNNPTQMLSVNGNIQLTGSTNAIYTNNIEATSASSDVFLFFSNTQKITMGSGMLVIDPASNNVGVGVVNPQVKLDVAGAVKIGSSSATCSSATQGLQRYNMNQMEFCDGTSWKAYGFKEPKNCLGAYTPCINGSRAFMIVQQAEPGGDACNMPNGMVDTTTCAVTAPATCTGKWSNCFQGFQTYNLSSDPGGCSPSQGAVQACDTVAPIASCDTGWASTGVDCLKDPDNPGPAIYTHNCNSFPAPGHNSNGVMQQMLKLRMSNLPDDSCPIAGPVTCVYLETRSVSGNNPNPGGGNNSGNANTTVKCLQIYDSSLVDDIVWCAGATGQCSAEPVTPSCLITGGTLTSISGVNKCKKDATLTCPASHSNLNTTNNTCSP